MICEWATQNHVRDFRQADVTGVWLRGTFVFLTTTPCHLGGSRRWFVCPRCWRRCAILYPVRCRKCMCGRYQTELLKPSDRRIVKAIKIRERLGQKKGGIVAPFPDKPVGMHWDRYLRIRDAAQKLERRIWRESWLEIQRLRGVSVERV